MTMSLTEREESKFSHKPLHEDPGKGLLLHTRAKQSTGETNFHSSSSDTLHVASETLTATADSESKNKRVLWLSDNIGQKFQIRTFMVDRKSTPENREAHINILPGSNHLFRCSNIRGMGSFLSRPENRGSMDTTRETALWKQNKHAGINGGRFSNPHFCQPAPQSKEHSPDDRQQNSIVLSAKNGGNNKCAPHGEDKIHFGVSTLKRSEFDSGISSNRPKHRSGLGISQCSRLDGVETLSDSLSSGLPTIWGSGRRPVCIKGFSSSFIF